MHFQAPLSVLRTFKGLEFGSVKFKHFKDFQGCGGTLYILSKQVAASPMVVLKSDTQKKFVSFDTEDN